MERLKLVNVLKSTDITWCNITASSTVKPNSNKLQSRPTLKNHYFNTLANYKHHINRCLYYEFVAGQATSWIASIRTLMVWINALIYVIQKNKLTVRILL